MAKNRNAGPAKVEVNMTPMIDCTFQLIIFFILTTQMANADLAPLKLHRPDSSIAMAEQTKRADKVIVNIVTEYGDQIDDRDARRSAMAKFYVISGNEFPWTDTDTLERVLEEYRKRAVKEGYADDFLVEVRGDQDIAYCYIEPVLTAAAKVGITKMNITAIVDPDMNVQK